MNRKLQIALPENWLNLFCFFFYLFIFYLHCQGGFVKKICRRNCSFAGNVKSKQ